MTTAFETQVQSLESALSGSSSTMLAASFPVHILEDCVKVVVNGCDKFITFQTFIDILEKSLGEERERSLQGMSLPSNTFFIATSASRVTINCYYTGGIRDVIYLGRSRPMVVPNIIISHDLVRRDADLSVQSTKYFCTDLGVGALPRSFISAPNPASRIYKMPFSNTYENCTMCYGGNSMPSRFPSGNLRVLDWYYQFLFHSSFNNDLGLYALDNQMSVSNWYDLLAKRAEEKGSFPYEKLSGYSEPTAPILV